MKVFPEFLTSCLKKPEDPDNLLKKYHDEDWHTPKGRQIREVAFSMNDGLVSTIGFGAGVTGSITDSKIVFLTGMAAIIAGAISMCIGAYIASIFQKEFFEKELS